ncbi:MAG: LysM peptidoglycan-binding domain-containing protein [Mariprofundus sp.]
MRFRRFGLPLLATSLLLLFSGALFAGQAQPEDTLSTSDVKENLLQPYVVKKGDTLWDIADYFFKNPRKWLKIWEHNLHITNPDLIYPGNRIWFDGSRLSQGGLTRVQPRPQVIIRPVERNEEAIDSSVLMTELQRHGFIQPDQIKGVGYVLGSQDDRLNYGVHDHVYLKLDQPAKAGTLFDVFRSADVLRNPGNGEELGILIKHMGVLKVVSQDEGVYRAEIVKVFEEISQGDRLQPVRKTALHIVPHDADSPLSGTLIYIQNDAHEAGEHQLVGINLGLEQGVTAGLKMGIFRAGRLVKDKVTGGEALLPQEKIGELLVLEALPRGVSIALITKSTAAINLGDAIHSSNAR